MKDNRRQYYNSQLRALEWEVKLYHDTVAELREAKDEIILARAQYDEGMPRGSAVGDQTAHRAMALSSPAIREMERRVTAIDRAMSEWTAKETLARAEFIRLKFWDVKYTDEGIAQKLNIGTDRTVRRWRRNFLQTVGQYLGWRT